MAGYVRSLEELQNKFRSLFTFPHLRTLEMQWTQLMVFAAAFVVVVVAGKLFDTRI